MGKRRRGKSQEPRARSQVGRYGTLAKSSQHAQSDEKDGDQSLSLRFRERGREGGTRTSQAAANRVQADADRARRMGMEMVSFLPLPSPYEPICPPSPPLPGRVVCVGGACGTSTFFGGAAAAHRCRATGGHAFFR